MVKYSRTISLIKIVLLLGTATIFAQVPDTLWTATYDGPIRDEIGESGQQTSDGGYIIAGFTSNWVAGEYDVYLVKTDANGDTVWTKAYGPSGAGNRDHAQSVQQTTDGGYVIGGSTMSFGAGNWDVWLLKTDSNGDTLWTKTYGGTNEDNGYSVQQTSDGGFIIAGGTKSCGAGGFDVYLIKTDTNGDTIWTRTYGGSSLDENGRSVKQITGGGFVIAGSVDGFNPDVYLIKTDSNGDTVWTKIYGGTDADVGFSVQQTSDGGFIIAGDTQSYGAGGFDVYLIKTDTNGDTIWTRTYGGTDSDVGYSVQQTTDGGYIVTGSKGYLYGGQPYTDVYLIKTDSNGDTLWTKTFGSTDDHNETGFSVQQTSDRGYIVVGCTESFGAVAIDFLLIRLTPDSLLTDDGSSLAYNGNRHLVRKPNSEILHIVYVMEGHIIYTTSTNGGTSWDALKNLGAGEFPAICLDFQGNPCVTWSNGDTLVYKREDPLQGWSDKKYTFGSAQPSHPVITITNSAQALPDSVHILARHYTGGGFSNNAIKEVLFPITNPSSYQTRFVESSGGINMVTLDFPSVVRGYGNTLHATWMHGDTVYYGTREVQQSSWNVWEDEFGDEGVQSNHPFVEAYGDSIFVVWQNESDDEVYRARKLLQEQSFQWANLSETSTTPSIYPVNASGMVTTFVDKGPFATEYDVFWKTSPISTLRNLSNTASTKSIFPQASLRIVEEQDNPYQYTIWQEGNASPYEIKFKKIIINPESPPAYFTSIAGFETPSLYLVKRDSFISSWQVPVDMGYEAIAYRFRLNPDYRYKLKAVAYHEQEDKWKTKVKIDNEEVGEIEYEAYKPETLELWISSEFYADSIINVVFECDDGDFAAVGPVYIYRYEYEEGGGNGGPMAQQSHSLNSGSITIFPNPFKDKLNIRYQTTEKNNVNLKIYDVTGRLIKQFNHLTNSAVNQVIWNGKDDHGRAVSQGVYFVQVENLIRGKSSVHKVIITQ